MTTFLLPTTGNLYVLAKNRNTLDDQPWLLQHQGTVVLSSLSRVRRPVISVDLATVLVSQPVDVIVEQLPLMALNIAAVDVGESGKQLRASNVDKTKVTPRDVVDASLGDSGQKLIADLQPENSSMHLEIGP
ncbi:hypothetical protein K7X08_000633 [Anisodus acutangulus]|uniref:Uncharacterized protein n=1 Tax=Anisodus acutangulus TaxID=402998 RepID=A0A9Q1M7B9_9SOLA|nr:hypothetical protein K7X08_000633 [Anisodus acutangulus]